MNHHVWNLLHIEKSQPMVRKYLLHREEGEIREVFVIYGIELVLLDQSKQVRELKGDDAGGFERNL